MVLPAMQRIVRKRRPFICTVRNGLAQLGLLGCARLLTMRSENWLPVPDQRIHVLHGFGKIFLEFLHH